MIDKSLYIVYSPAHLQSYKKGLKCDNHIKPFFSNSLSEAKRYAQKHPHTLLVLRKNIYYTKLLDIIELYNYLDILPSKHEKEVVTLQPTEGEIPKPRKRGRPRKNKS